MTKRVEGGREGCRRMLHIATASTPPAPGAPPGVEEEVVGGERVLRAATSQRRDLPVWST